MGESWRCYTVVWNKQVTDKYCGIPLTQGTWSSQNREDRKYNGDFQGEGGKGELLLNKYRVSVLQDEKNYGDRGW